MEPNRQPESGSNPHPWPVALGWGFASVVAAFLWMPIVGYVIMPIFRAITNIGVATSMGRASPLDGWEVMMFQGIFLFAPLGAITKWLNDKRSSTAFCIGWIGIISTLLAIVLYGELTGR